MARQQEVVASAVTLINDLADRVEATAGDPQRVQELADSLRASGEQLAAAVAENTPGAPVE